MLEEMLKLKLQLKNKEELIKQLQEENEELQADKDNISDQYDEYRNNIQSLVKQDLEHISEGSHEGSSLSQKSKNLQKQQSIEEENKKILQQFVKGGDQKSLDEVLGKIDQNKNQFIKNLKAEISDLAHHKKML